MAILISRARTRAYLPPGSFRKKREIDKRKRRKRQTQNEKTPKKRKMVSSTILEPFQNEPKSELNQLLFPPRVTPSSRSLAKALAKSWKNLSWSRA